MQKTVNLLEQIYKNNQPTYKVINFTFAKVLLSFLLPLLLFINAFGQSAQHTENKTDQTLRGSGRVNQSTLGMEIDIPLGSYPGRGIDVPISLSYTSKLWRMDFNGMIEGGIITGGCRSVNLPKYSETSASGWSTSLAVPYIEYTGKDNIYNDQGFPFDQTTANDPNCESPQSYSAYIRRLTIHLPGGETHELRSDDNVTQFPPHAPLSCYGADTSQCPYPEHPNVQQNWNRTFYAVDGSNIKYIENSNNNTYRLLMPDGSHYDFANTLDPDNESTARLALTFTDRNGNYTSYSNSTGSWTDTLGKTLTAPIGPKAPTTPTTAENPQSYSMPGMTGTYKFHWKYLKGSSAAESGLTNFEDSLRYHGDKYGIGVNGNWNTRPANTYLFGSVDNNFVLVTNDQLFNPIVLTEIELPTGQKYKFSYNIYGLINKITYPTGGDEHFVYNAIKPLAVSDGNNASDQTNFGVTNRKVYQTAGQGTPYEWNYLTEYVAPGGYKISTTAPDNTLNELSLHRSNGVCNNCSVGQFGYDNGLAGMPYEELNFSSPGQSEPRKLVSRKLTSWTITKLNVWVEPATNQSNGYVFSNAGNWHPRVNQRETIVYDSSGDGVSATTKYEYENESALTLRDTPVLMNKTTQYAFVGIAASAGRPEPGEDPEPDPTPVPTPTPSSLTPVKVTETTYLINDTVNYPDANIRNIYKNQNMVGLVTVSVIKNGAETVVSRSETKYDDVNYSPNVGRGNPTTERVWDSTKGNYDNPGAYIQTRDKFDSWGNQYEEIDAKGNITTTEYDATHHTFPIKVTTAVPDTTGVNGSNTAFVTETTFNYTTGLPISTKDANEQITTIEYDAATLRPKKVTPPTGAGTAETFYNDAPNNYWVKNKTQIDANKWAEKITHYDGLGRAFKSEQIDLQGNIFVEKEFDAQGRVKRVTNPYRSGETKHWTTNIYDETSRIKEIVLPDGAKVITDYGVAITGSQIGETETTTDQAGKKIRSITDVFDEVIRVDEPDNNGDLGTVDNPIQPTYYSYDTLGEMVKVTQGAQNRFFMYDSLGRLLRIRQPEQDVNNALNTIGNPENNQWTVGFTYDDNENISTSTDSKGVTITYGYDNLDRIITRTYSDGTTPPVSHKYDNLQFGKGKLIQVSNSISTSKTTQFNNLGKVVSYQQITDGQTYTSVYEYNPVGILIGETYPSGKQVKFDFDADGDLLRVWGQVGQNQKTYADSFSFTTSKAVEKFKLGNGLWETAEYNNRLQPFQLGLGNSATDTSVWKVNYDYGEIDVNGILDTNKNTGNIAKQTLTVSGMANHIVQSYKYDSLDRLTEAKETSNNQQNWIQQFGYDRYGNRTSFNQQIGTSQINQTPSVDPNKNRFTTGQNYTYDFNGNLIQNAEGRQFTFNGDNKQTQVKDVNNNVIGTYYYDGEGKRIKKVTDLETTIFVYSTGKLIAEYSTQLPSNQTTSYLTLDHLGTPRVITDASGQVISRRDFMPFGEELPVDIGGRAANLKYGVSDNVRQKFTGYQKDKETNLDFAEARYYNNSHGRFTAVDPLLASGKSDNPQSFNRYLYVMNSPTKLIDPTGLLPASSSACRQCGKGDLFKGLDSFEERLKATIQSGINFLTKRDMALLQFHVSNGTALGHYYLNNAQQTVRPVPPRRGRRGGNGNRDRYYRGRGLPWHEAMRPTPTRRKPIQSGVNGLILNQNPSNLTHNQIYNAFRNTPFEISSHGIQRVRQRVRNLSEWQNDFNRAMNNGSVQGVASGSGTPINYVRIEVTGGQYRTIVDIPLMGALNRKPVIVSIIRR